VTRVDLETLTPVAQDYLKVIWSATEWGQDPITATALAARFGTSVANVTVTVKRLAAQGLVIHTPYKPVRLTPAGEAFAVAMVRRHRLLETFLVRELGYGWDEVHDEAERLEHAVSEKFVERIDAALGHPTADPHGDPIPAAGSGSGSGSPGHEASARAWPAGAVVLAEASEGERTVLRVSDADARLLGEAADLGLLPGARVVVTRAGDGVDARALGTAGSPDASSHGVASADARSPNASSHGVAVPGAAVLFVDGRPVSPALAAAVWVA
jgi:DtxR family Mn-dependent transcriptional regulator